MNQHPSVRVYRELYYASPGPGVAQWLTPAYAGSGLARAEILTTSSESDAYRGWVRRASPDDGRSWGALQPIPDVVRETREGGIVVYPSHPWREPASGRSYRFFMQRQWPGAPCYTYQWKNHQHAMRDHVFVSENDGPARLLRYEPGADYRPDQPFDPAFLNANVAYFGNAPAAVGDGTVLYPVCIARPEGAIGTGGVCLFRRDPASGDWHASNVCPIDPAWSSRGLLEPEAAVLRDGRVMIIARGSNTSATPGRKWRIMSADGGRTLGPVEELLYDDGSRFYSPSSIHRFIRSSRTGTLYWLANIVPGPPQANGPRYPLVIAEIDEDRAAVRKDSLIELDTRQPGEPAALQLSNFSVLENRAGDIEIYITLLGLRPDDFWRSDVYRYVFTP